MGSHPAVLIHILVRVTFAKVREGRPLEHPEQHQRNAKIEEMRVLALANAVVLLQVQAEREHSVRRKDLVEQAGHALDLFARISTHVLVRHP